MQDKTSWNNQAPDLNYSCIKSQSKWKAKPGHVLCVKLRRCWVGGLGGGPLDELEQFRSCPEAAVCRSIFTLAMWFSFLGGQCLILSLLIKSSQDKAHFPQGLCPLPLFKINYFSIIVDLQRYVSFRSGTYILYHFCPFFTSDL